MKKIFYQRTKLTGYTVENYMTARLHVVLKRKDCCVLTRQSLPLIDCQETVISHKERSSQRATE